MNQTVGEVTAGAPAAAVLKPGDRIVAVDGKSLPVASTAKTGSKRFGEARRGRTSAPASRPTDAERRPR